MKIPVRIIDVVRAGITNRSPVLKGANRDPLGETLYEKHRFSPQTMSYVLPLLVEDRFCTVNDRKAFVIHRK